MIKELIKRISNFIDITSFEPHKNCDRVGVNILLILKLRLKEVYVTHSW